MMAYDLAMQRALQRTVQALFREGLLPASGLQPAGRMSWLPLTPEISCGFKHIRFGLSGSCRFDGPVTWHVQGKRPAYIRSPIGLLQRLSPFLPMDVSPISLVRFNSEIANHIQNDALCIAYRRGWGRDLAALVKQAGYAHFLSWLQAVDHVDNKTLLLEQWGAIGHPWHPNYKTKLGLQADEVIEMSPEFCANISIAIAALRADAAEVVGVDGVTAYQDWFAAHYPVAWQVWQQSMLDAGEQSAAWLPVPLHPYQLRHTLPKLYANELQQGVLRLLPAVSIQASPTMSFRSVVPEASTQMPHMKLPVTLRLTSVQRTVSPKSAVMGTRFSQLFHTITQRGDFDPRLSYVPEQVGVFYRDDARDDERSRHLAVLYRQNPLHQIAAGQLLMPVGSLFAETPLSGQPLMTELVEVYAQHHAQHHPVVSRSAAALAFFRTYAEMVVGATLHAYLTLGIAFEAHQQNTFVVLNEQLLPSKILIRDFGDARIYAPQLQAAGYRLEAYCEGHSLFHQVDTVRDKFLHAIMLCHIGEFAVTLARCYQLDEAVFWRALRQIVEDTFMRCQGQVESTYWQQEYQAMLHQAWPAKAFIRMRMSDTQDDILHHMNNPLLV